MRTDSTIALDFHDDNGFEQRLSEVMGRLDSYYRAKLKQLADY